MSNIHKEWKINLNFRDFLDPFFLISILMKIIPQKNPAKQLAGSILIFQKLITFDVLNSSAHPWVFLILPAAGAVHKLAHESASSLCIWAFMPICCGCRNLGPRDRCMRHGGSHAGMWRYLTQPRGHWRYLMQRRYLMHSAVVENWMLLGEV